ncbi:MAG: alpha-2-macroglobulin family protein [Flavobacteriales bacterium]
MRLVRLFLLFALVPLLITCRQHRGTVKQPDAPDPRWTAIDSLSRIGQYAAALERTQALLDEAQASGDWRTEFRAWQHRSQYRSYTGANNDSSLLAMEARASTADVPLKQLLHSALATGWWQRYEQDRWRVLDRTANAEESDDPATWSQPTYMRKVIAHFRASLEPVDTLQVIPAGELGDLLIGDDVKARALRPMLYDILAHRALGVFTNSETRLAEPSWRFTLNDPKDFELFEAFVFRPLAHRDSTSWEFQAFGIYQRLERTHLNNDTPDALVDVTLQRLAFVHERSLLSDKDSLYLNALERLSSRLPNDTCQAEVTYALAQWHREQGGKYQRLGTNAWKWENRTARTLCEEAIVKFPGSFGAQQCARLKAELEVPALRVEVENAVVPDDRSAVAVHYRNVKRVGLRVVKDEVVDEPTEERRDYEKWLLAQKPVRAWSVELPDDGDLNEHLIELPVDGLPMGRYSLLAAIDESFGGGNGSFAHAAFWSTRIAVVERVMDGSDELLVLDRALGTPITGAIVERWTRANRWDRQEKSTRAAHATTDEEGRVRFVARTQQQYHHTIVRGEDRYRTGTSWNYDTGNRDPQEELRTYLFTDRAIYRPGQVIQFKGLVVARTGKKADVRVGQRSTLRFFDVNGELIDSVNVTTDAFGAYHGSFTAPAGRLTGTMRIQAEHGSTWVRVEEYKRPTFELVFDPVSGSPKLNEEATVTGVAKSYAGIPLDGAVVKWNVQRGVRMPWWCGWGWRGLPWGRETEVASGETVCDAQGKFTITFQAEADRAFPRDADPSFHFTVNADATDISGETQSGSTDLTLAYRAFDIGVGIGEAFDRETTDSIDVRIRNLNGEEVDVPMDLRIVELVPPVDAPRRERLWERPDRILEGELPTTHLSDDPMSWPVNKVWLERRDHRAKGRAMSVKALKDAPVGMYRIEVEAKAADGDVVKVAKLFTLYDTAIQNTGFIDEAFHVEPVTVDVEPGGKAVVLISSALPGCRVLMEVEREERIAVSRSFTLSKGQQRVELPVLEGDRGGFAVHFVCVERGRAHLTTQWISVPWSNKELQVEWMSFRDKLLPGAKEEWRLRITGPKKEKVAAQLLAVMYDASLDHFTPHAWNGFAWPMNSARLGWQRNEPFGAQQGGMWNTGITLPNYALRAYPYLVDLGGSSLGHEYIIHGIRSELDVDNAAVPMRAGGRGEGIHDALERNESAFRGNVNKKPVVTEAAPPTEADAKQHSFSSDGPQPVRTNFRETAFFFPDLLTDRDGSVVLRFTTPDALTRWKVMGMAHTKELQLGQFTKEAVTSKPLMVVPNLPRFLRQGDRITLTAKVNATEGAVSGMARVALFDPRTNAEVTKRYISEGEEVPFNAAPGASAVVAWPINVPADADLVSVRITVTGAGIADGEERPLPILTDKVLVTESLPLPITKAGTRTLTLEKLVNNTSSSLQHRSLKLEFTPNPAWYAVQALPYLMEFPHACAEQTFSRYYANRLAAHIVEQRPQVKRVFEQWSKAGADAFMSALEKNAELKGIVLEETPWLLNAKDEGERKRRIALFFDLQRMTNEEQASLKQLRDMQLPNGAWPWWSGMQPSRYITQHIIAGFGHLEFLKAADTRGDGPNEQMLKHAVRWLDAEVDREHKEYLRRTKAEDREHFVPSSVDIHLLYARSFFQRWPIDGATRTAVDFLLRRCKDSWLQRSLQEQAMLALAFDRLGERTTAQLILKSLGERATRSEELGMYWKGFNAGYEWWSFPTETHALLIEAFHEVGKDKESTDQLRQYLLKLKQTTDWRTTKATAEACYALLLTGDDWLVEAAAPVIKVGGETVKPDQQEAGTGYFERTWTGAEVKPGMGQVSITTAKDGVQWGALHWQYLEQMDKVTAHESPFSVKKQVMLERATDAGPQLVALTEGTELRAGDRVTIRIELRTDRYLDFVHLKDQRAAGLELVEALSGHRWQGGLGFYQSIRDAAMHFFFDRLVPGTHVFEYALKVTHAGSMSNGLTTAMCMYAPEFSAHSEGLRLEVRP